MRTRLIRANRTAIAAVTIGALVLGVIAVLVHDDTRGNAVDDAVLRWVDSLPGWFVDAALRLTDPVLVVALLVVTAVVAAVARRWDAVALVVVAPPVEVVLTEFVLKPIVHRTNEIVTDGLGLTQTLAYPSGHETGLASLVTVTVVILLGSQRTMLARATTVIVGTLVLVLGAIGLVGNFYHYASDTIGAVCLAIAVTVTVAAGIDQTSAIIGQRREPVRSPR